MRRIGVATLVLLALAAGAYAFTFGARRADGPREVVLIAKDMVFAAPEPPGGASAAAAPSGETPGPTIVLRAGERVRIVLRNQDPGMRHDLVADHLGLRTEAIDHGQTDEVDFRVPNAKSEGEYYCSFHSRLMRGRIVVR
jgi:FtsP/CotA-like multicopper oxidase with cupredoxin domain